MKLDNEARNLVITLGGYIMYHHHVDSLLVHELHAMLGGDYSEDENELVSQMFYEALMQSNDDVGAYGEKGVLCNV